MLWGLQKLDGPNQTEQIRMMDRVVGAAPRGEFASLARSKFFDQLREIHKAAGSPSTRQLEQMSRVLAENTKRPDVRLSHATFHKALAGPAVASWRTVQVLVTILRGNSARIRFFWEEAKAEENASKRAVKDGVVTVKPDDSVRNSEHPETQLANPVPQSSEFSSWQLDYDWRTAPPVIRLLAAAVRDNIDPRKLLFDIAPDDPSGAAPAVALVLDNDPERAADVVAYVASVSRNKGIELLIGTAALRPLLMDAIIPLLHDRHDFDTESLLVAAMYGCVTSERQLEIATWLIKKIYSIGKRESLVATLVCSFEKTTEPPPWVTRSDLAENPVPTWVSKVDGDVMFRATCKIIETLVGDPEHTKWGVNLLAWISKRDYRTAMEIFINIIIHVDGETRKIKSDPSRTVLAALARGFPHGTARLLMRSLLETEGGLTPIDTGLLLCLLAKEDLPLTCELSELMLMQSSESLELILGNGDDLPAVAEIVLWLYSKHPSETARLLRGWLAKDRSPRPDLGRTLHRGQRVQPFGMLTASMMYLDAERAIECLISMVGGLGYYRFRSRPLNLLEGLDQDDQLRDRTRDRLRRYAGVHWPDFRAYLPL